MASKTHRAMPNAKPAKQKQGLPFPVRHALWIAIFSLLVITIPRLFGNRGAIEGSQETGFRVVDLPGKGKGLVAARDIKRGELLIREKPLFVVPLQVSTSPSHLIWTSVQKLQRSEQEAFMNLSYVNFPNGVDPKKHPEEVALAIFQTNAVSAGGGSVGIFPHMARLNHGCAGSFNSVYNWRENEGVLVVHALKDIQKGQELLTTYLNTKRSRAQRRAYLAEHYGFRCSCNACSLADDLSRVSDDRLERMGELYTRFSSWGKGMISGVEAVSIVNGIWKLGDEEGYWSERGRLAADAAWVAAAHSDADATRRWIGVSIEWYGSEIGKDSKEVDDLRVIAKSPMRHEAWGQREEETVGGPAYE